MALTRTDDTRSIKGIKVKATTLAEITAYLPHLDECDLAWVEAVAGSDGGLYIKVSGSLVKICEVGSEVTP